MIYVLALDSENTVHEVLVNSWKEAMMNINFWEVSLTLKQVFLTEQKSVRYKKIKEWEKWLSE